MSISSHHLLEKGIELCKSGQKTQARQILEAVIYSDRQNESAWVWYIAAQETKEGKISALERFLSLFPDHPAGRMALAKLKSADTNESKAQETPLEKSQMVERTEGAAPGSEKKLPSPQSTFVRGIPWYLILLSVCILLCSGGIFISRYNSLRAENENLTATNRTVSTNLDQSKRDNETLRQENNQLVNEYNSLAGQYNSVKSEYSTLLVNFNSLTNDHNNLVNTYNSLLNEYNITAQSYSQFKETAIAPPYIYIHGRQVMLAFLTPDGTTYTWEVPFENLEYDLKRGNNERFRSTTDLNYPRLSLTNSTNGEVYRIIDYRRFVDPSSFTSFSRYFYDRSSSEYDFINEMWYIVAQLTAYSREIKDTPRYPLETLLAGGGDCEDHAILFASMILAAAPKNWQVDLVYMDSDSPTSPQTVNHVIVYIDTGNQQYTVEATGKDLMEPYSQGVYGWHSEIER